MRFIYLIYITTLPVIALMATLNAVGQPLYDYETLIPTTSIKSQYNLFPGNIQCQNKSYATNTSKASINGDSTSIDYAIISDFNTSNQFGILKKISLKDNTELINFGLNFNTSRNYPTIKPFIASNNLTAGAVFGNIYMNFPWMMTALDSSTPAPKYEEHRTNLISYLRGSQSPITATTNSIQDNFFDRDSNKMGMLVNSTPWIQTAPSSKILYPDQDSYKAFRSTYANRRNVVWVGSNDGMIHGFYADNGDFLMSYLPSPLFSRLYDSVQPGRSPEALMDGSPFTADIGYDFTSIPNVNAYVIKTLLFSSMGRAAKAFFALDVTDPKLLTENNSRSIFQWIFSDVDDPDLGYILSNNSIHPLSNQPTSSVLTQNNRDFGILLPNGVDSINNKSVLYVLFSNGPHQFKQDAAGNPTRDPRLTTHQYANSWSKGTAIGAPARYVKLVAPKSQTTSNGLVGLTWAASSSTGEASYVYATDLNGKLWKFDISKGDFTYWQGFEGTSTDQSSPSPPTLVFDANEGRSSSDPVLKITTAPILRFDTKGRVNIIFGTGSALTDTEFQDTSSKNRIYSIIDTPSATTTYKHASLSSRNLSETDTMTYISDASDVSSSNGWVVYFRNGSGEKVINNPVILGDTIFVNTSAPPSGCVTQARVYAIDASTGKANSSALGTTSVTINKVTKEVNALAIKSKDQSTVVFTKSDGLKNTVQIVGKSDNIKGISYYTTNRHQWRTLPGMKSTQ